MWYHVIMTKNIKQMNKSELIGYAAEVGREDINEDMTKREIIASLEEDGLDDVEQSKPVEEDKKDIPASDGDKKVIKMLTKTAYYSYGAYVFTKEQPFVLMDAESADRITEINPDRFALATTREIEAFYQR